MENEKIFELIEKMYIELKEIKNDVKNSKENVESIENDVKNNKENIEGIEKIVLRIEQNHGNKLEALFDGYKQNTEQLNRIENEVSKHEEIILRRIK